MPPLPVAARSVVTAPFDAYLSLRDLSKYCGLCERTLRSYIKDPTHPLPCFQAGRKILVRRSEFDRWIEAFRRRDGADLDMIVQQVVKDVN
jgi:hypothetical protein